MLHIYLGMLVSVAMVRSQDWSLSRIDCDWLNPRHPANHITAYQADAELSNDTHIPWNVGKGCHGEEPGLVVVHDCTIKSNRTLVIQSSLSLCVR